MSAKLTRAQFAMQCSFLASEASHWAGDLLTLPELINEEATPSSVMRFTNSIRERLDIIEDWAGIVRDRETKP